MVLADKDSKLLFHCSQPKRHRYQQRAAADRQPEMVRVRQEIALAHPRYVNLVNWA
ncbi:hypothetical protein RSal33209_0024 [Renibacterium salmoninarum ATCC 33209]|uniref:Uncharacterized protein n=1 Tax=Renibacterium salmoninarum (strain ATCC 33209 / DSM 20767 / JCM 11484 / NBRC 15589 / NCIMB 2235) TaxID=288705 RepID=A9WL68_RENSM|nr:hypothetical protein [Renibacterium salmoninarum]ABY21782.1 hypothetical protein RSal33209_0024 [Renibacterium salmoninarum ATCC 33209]